MKKINIGFFIMLLALAMWSCDAGYDDWDADESGFLDADEFGQGFGAMGYFNGWDVDDEEGLTQDEFYTGVFNTMDNDNNNLLDADEWDTYGSRYADTYDEDPGTFDEMDTDMDNYIGYDEYYDHAINKYGYKNWDADGNELVDRNEFNTGVFYLLDENDDNQIARDEFSAWQDNYSRDGIF